MVKMMMMKMMVRKSMREGSKVDLVVRMEVIKTTIILSIQVQFHKI